MLFTPRLTAPSSTNKHYLKKGRIANALNECIEIAKGSCLANCVGYVWVASSRLLESDLN